MGTSLPAVYSAVPGSGITGATACEELQNPGDCATLTALGATDQNLLDFAYGAYTLPQELDALSGNAGAPVTPTASNPLLAGLGSAIDAISDPVGGTGLAQNFNQAVTNLWNQLTAWISANWWVVAVAVLGVVMLIVWAYGGFKGVLG